MSRPVLLILMLLAGWWWLSRLGTRSSRSLGQGQAVLGGQGSARRLTKPETSQPIEQCAMCGVHTPCTGMVALAGGHCHCPEHADRGNA